MIENDFFLINRRALIFYLTCLRLAMRSDV